MAAIEHDSPNLNVIATRLQTTREVGLPPAAFAYHTARLIRVS